MLMPTHCPACNELLIDKHTAIYSHNGTLYQRLDRFCNLHQITYCSSTKSNATCYIIAYDLKPTVRALWYPPAQSFLFNTHGPESQCIDYHLPYFEPDWHDFNAMIIKLNTYLTFL
jgi:hypothetical protein